MPASSEEVSLGLNSSAIRIEPGRHAGEQPQHPAPDIADVACPLAQQGARERLEPGGVARIRFAPRIGAAASVRQPGDGEIDQLGIGEQLEMSIENLRRSSDVGRPLGFDLLPGALERDVEVRALALDAGAPLLDVDRGAAQLRDLAEHEPGRCAHSEELAGVGRACRAFRGRGRRGDRRTAGGPGRCLGCGLRLARPRGQERRERAHGGGRIRTRSADADRVVRPGREQQDGGHRLGIRGIGTAQQSDVGAKALGRGGYGRRRARVQALPVRQADLLRDGGCLGRGAAVGGSRGGEVGLQDDAAARLDETRGDTHSADALAVRDEHLGEQARCGARDEIGVEGDQRLAGRHAIPLPHARREALAIQRDGIDADVHENLETLVGRDGQSMRCAVQERHPAGGRRQQLARGGIDRDSVSHRTLREHRVRYALERHEDSGERREQGDSLRCRGHGASGGTRSGVMGVHFSPWPRILPGRAVTARPAALREPRGQRPAGSRGARRPRGASGKLARRPCSDARCTSAARCTDRRA